MPRRERGSVVPGAEPACERSRLSVAAGRAVPQWADAGSVHVRLGTPTDQCAGLAIGPADFDLIRRAQGWGYLAPGAGQGRSNARKRGENGASMVRIAIVNASGARSPELVSIHASRVIEDKTNRRSSIKRKEHVYDNAHFCCWISCCRPRFRNILHDAHGPASRARDCQQYRVHWLWLPRRALANPDPARCDAAVEHTPSAAGSDAGASQPRDRPSAAWRAGSATTQIASFVAW